MSVFTYPENDEIPYLSHFKDDFETVFVVLPPFLKLNSTLPKEHENFVSDHVTASAKQIGHAAGVSWQLISELCGSSSIAQVNRALRLTGSKRIVAEFSCPKDTKKLLGICNENNLALPDEGYISPLQELSLACFLKTLGLDEVVAAGHFGGSLKVVKSSSFSQSYNSANPEIYAADHSLYVTNYFDYHYLFICQMPASRAKANPAEYFEGFFADEGTNDFLGHRQFPHRPAKPLSDPIARSTP